MCNIHTCSHTCFILKYLMIILCVNTLFLAESPQKCKLKKSREFQVLEVPFQLSRSFCRRKSSYKKTHQTFKKQIHLKLVPIIYKQNQIHTNKIKLLYNKTTLFDCIDEKI